MASAVIAQHINFFGLGLNGTDPIPEDLMEYLNQRGVQLSQSEGYISIYGEYKIDPQDLRKNFPQLFEKYKVNKYITHSYDGCQGITYYQATSISKQNHSEKYWLEKNINDKYKLTPATHDVVRAAIASAVFGEKSFSKVKFDVENLGVVTRTQYPDQDIKRTYTLASILEFMQEDEIDLSKETIMQELLLNLIMIGLLTENRALSAFTIGCELSPKQNVSKLNGTAAPIIHNIFPFKFWNFPPNTPENTSVLSFAELAPQLLRNYAIICDIICDDSSHWNRTKVADFMLEQDYTLLDSTKDLLTNNFTQQDFNAAFLGVINAIAKDDYAVCKQVKEKIYADLHSAKSNFTCSEIEKKVMPRVDELMVTLQNNINSAYECFAALDLEPVINADPKPVFTP